MPRNRLGVTPRVDEYQCCAVLADQLGQPIVDFGHTSPDITPSSGELGTSIDSRARERNPYR